MNDKTTKIYEYLKSQKVKNLPATQEEFSSKMSNDENLRSNVYKYLSERNIKNFPQSREEFDNFFFQETEPQEEVSTSDSQTPAQPFTESGASIEPQPIAQVQGGEIQDNYILNGSPITKEDLQLKISDKDFVDGLISGDTSLTINNDPELQTVIQNAVEAKQKKDSGGIISDFFIKSYDVMANQLPSAWAAWKALELPTVGEAFKMPAEDLKYLPKEYRASDVINKEAAIEANKNLKNELLNYAQSKQLESGELSELTVNTISEIQDPIDAIRWLTGTMGETVSQIAPTVMTGGGTSIVQEVGSIYLDGVLSKAEELNKTPEDVIREGLDDTETAKAFGYAAAMLDRVGAGSVVSSIGKRAFRDGLVKRTIPTLKAIAKSPSLQEGVTEGIQTILEQVGTNVSADKKIEIDIADVLEASAKGFVGSKGITITSNYLKNSAVTKDNVEELNEISKDPEKLQSIKDDINDRVEAGDITQEQADKSISELELDVNANLEIPEKIQGEDRVKAIELQRKYNEVKQSQEQASEAFKPLYKAELDDLSQQLQELALKKPQESKDIPLQEEQKGQDITEQKETEQQKPQGNAKKQQGGQVRQQGSPQKGKSTSNKNMPKGNGTVVQDGKKSQTKQAVGNPSKAKQAFNKQQKPSKGIKEIIKNPLRKFIRRFVNRNADIKRLLNKTGLDKVTDRLVTAFGASGRAKMIFEDAYNKIYKGLSNKKKKKLDEIIFHRRIAAIDENREKRGLPPVKHPDNITGNDSMSRLEELKQDDDFKDLNKRADEYFKVYKDALKRAKDGGLITQELYDNMVDIDYQPRKFIQHLLDVEGNVSERDLSRLASEFGMSQPIIKSLKEGSEGAMITDSEYLLSNYINSIEKRLFQNEVAKKLAKEYPKAIQRLDELRKKKDLTKSEREELGWLNELEDKIKDNPIVGRTKSGNPKYKYEGDSMPNGYSNLYYYEDGEQKRMIIEDNLFDQWMDNKKLINNPKLKSWISAASGSALLKFFATGANPFFVITNTPRDFGHIVMFTDNYSSFLPIAIPQLAIDFADATGDIAKKNQTFRDFVEYGGMMDFLFTQGGINEKNMLKDAISSVFGRRFKDRSKSIADFLTSLNMYSEVGFRLAVYKRNMKNLLKEIENGNYTDKEKSDLIEDAKYRAARKAREIIDFNQGGYITKDLESGLPYINAATQGTRVAAEYMADNPAKAAYKTLQAAGIISGGITAVSIGIISLLSDDDEEMTPVEIWAETMQGISQYEKRAYIIIPMGKKDKDGNWMYDRIAKTQQARPIFSISDFYVENFVRDLAGKEKIEYEYMVDAVKETFLNDFSPLDPRIDQLFGLVGRNPLIGGGVEYATGYDFFRDEKIHWTVDKEGVPRELEGYFDKRTPTLYKVISDKTGASPARTQHLVEKFITSPTTNPYTSIIYGIGNVASSELEYPEAIKKEGIAVADRVFDKFIRSTSPYYYSKKATINIEDEIKEEQKEMFIKSENIKSFAKEMKTKLSNGQDIRGDVRSFVEENFEPQERKSAQERIIRYIKVPNVNHAKLDIYYERNPEIKAMKFFNEYGVLDRDAMRDALRELKITPSDRFIIKYKQIVEQKTK